MLGKLRGLGRESADDAKRILVFPSHSRSTPRQFHSRCRAYYVSIVSLLRLKNTLLFELDWSRGVFDLPSALICKGNA